VPLSPDLCRSEHTTRSTHVTKSSLTSTVGSSSRDTGNTSNSATCVEVKLAIAPQLLPSGQYAPSCIFSKSQSSKQPLLSLTSPSSLEENCVLTSTPGLSRSLVTSLLAHGIWLALILRNTSVDGLDDIRSDRSSEDLYFNSISSIPLHLHAHTTNQRANRGSRTFGRGWVAPLAEPSAFRMVTVGREAISTD
jgi:hypothetical protein